MANFAMGLVVFAALLGSACFSGDEDTGPTMSLSAAPASTFDATEETAALSGSSPESEITAGRIDSKAELGLFTGAAIVESGNGFASTANALQTARSEVISTADITILVDDVQTAADLAQSTVEGMGGFVERLSSSGGQRRQNANITMRVPQARFSLAVSRIEALGLVESRNLGVGDVSAQFIDLNARLKSLLREEESLLGLLERTKSVTEVLAIERELFRVRAEIERAQGQQNYLERRVDLATINLTLVPIDDQMAAPPSASLAIDVDDVGATVTGIKGMVASVDGLVDRVFFSTDGSREEADLSIRVHARDFERVVDFVVSQGKVRSKTLSESTGLTDNDDSPTGRPDAVIAITLAADPGGGWLTVLKVLGIILGIGVLGAAVVMLIRFVLGSVLFQGSSEHDRFA